MTWNLRLIPLTFLLYFLSSCRGPNTTTPVSPAGNGDSSTPSTPTPDPPPTEGNIWSTDIPLFIQIISKSQKWWEEGKCLYSAASPLRFRFYKISEKFFERHELGFVDRKCWRYIHHVVMRFKYTVKDCSTKDSCVLSLSYDSLGIIPQIEKVEDGLGGSYDVDEPREYNSKKQCGFSDWKQGEMKIVNSSFENCYFTANEYEKRGKEFASTRKLEFTRDGDLKIEGVSVWESDVGQYRPMILDHRSPEL